MSKRPEQNIYEFDDYRLDAGQLMLSRNGEEILLPPKVVETLLVLVEHRGRIVSKNELLEAVWQDVIVEESNLYGYLHVLRNALGDQPNGKPYIETLRRRGYRFNGEVRVVREELPEEQYPGSVDAGTGALDSPGDTTGNDLPESTLKRKRSTYVYSIALGVLLLGALFAGYFYWGSGQDTAAANPDAPKRIAVLPFKPLAAENSDAFLEIGMADALVRRLGEGRGFEVQPLDSVRPLANTGQDALKIGREAAADVVVEGTVQRSGDTIHATVRLVSVADGSVLWSNTVDGNYSELLAERGLIDRLAGDIALKLASGAGTAVVTHSTENVEAWEHYLRASYQVGQPSRTTILESIKYYNRAIERDPYYALAHAGLARAYISLAPCCDSSPTDVFPKAKVAAERALEIDERLAEGYSALGSILFWYERDWSGAEERCKRAIELNPNSADARYTYAHLLSNLGRHPEALAEIKRARELDPINLRIDALESLFLHHAGQTDEALDRLRKTADPFPNFWLPHFYIASIHIEKGMYPEAVAEAELARKLSDASSYPIALKGYALARSGKKAEARMVLDALLKQTNEDFIPSYYFALIYNGLGETDKALSSLERSFQQRDSMMVFLKVEPKWNNLRSEPRFKDLLKRMNLE